MYVLLEYLNGDLYRNEWAHLFDTSALPETTGIQINVGLLHTYINCKHLKKSETYSLENLRLYHFPSQHFLPVRITDKNL